jgi:hypothetical protein
MDKRLFHCYGDYEFRLNVDGQKVQAIENFVGERLQRLLMLSSFVFGYDASEFI